jgi:hypothetical protein
VTEVQQAVRPEPPREPKPGYKWASAEAEDAGVAEPGKTCRYRVPGPQRACGKPAGIYLVRGIGTRVKWHYCVPEHSYGHWVEDGKVLHWTEVPEEGSDGAADAGHS